MFDRIRQAKQRRASGEGGFTLIELLVVITILGILAAVVVFAVSGINDKGQDSACKIDTRTLATAEEAYLASPVGAGQYANEATLVSGGFLSALSTYHDVTPNNGVTPPTYLITIQDSRCGAVGSPVGGTNF